VYTGLNNRIGSPGGIMDVPKRHESALLCRVFGPLYKDRRLAKGETIGLNYPARLISAERRCPAEMD
jgi:hypothetical protein